MELTLGKRAVPGERRAAPARGEGGGDRADREWGRGPGEGGGGRRVTGR
ncbi:hypothetical protein GCM10010493_78240 [Streptomyces lavendulae subsp. grasserius]